MRQLFSTVVTLSIGAMLALTSAGLWAVACPDGIKDQGLPAAKQVKALNVYEHIHASTAWVKVYKTPDGNDPDGWGTGSIIHGNDGTTFVWTAAHVIQSALDDKGKLKGRITVNMKHIVDGEDIGDTEIEADVIRTSEPNYGEDLAVLHVKIKNWQLTSRYLLNLESYPRLGDTLIVCGAGSRGPIGLVAASGTLGRRGVKFRGKQFDYTNMSALAGVSGGPITNSRGEVVGMITNGYGETHSYFVPAVRIHKWAKKVNVWYALDTSVAEPKEFGFVYDPGPIRVVPPPVRRPGLPGVFLNLFGSDEE